CHHRRQDRPARGDDGNRAAMGRRGRGLTGKSPGAAPGGVRKLKNYVHNGAASPQHKPSAKEKDAMTQPLPPKDELTICFAHVAYRLAERFAVRNTGIRHFEVRSVEELGARIAEADVLVVSGFWRNEFAARAPKLRFIQSISAGVDQYGRDALKAHGIRL